MSDSNGLTAGWYPDPAGTDALRWWDGGAWTTQLRPNQAPPASVGVGSWILPSPGNGPGSGFSPAAIAAPAQPLAITATVTAPYSDAPPADYGRPALQANPYAQQAPQAEHYRPQAHQPDHFAQFASSSSYGVPMPAEPVVSGPTRSAQTVGIWLLAVYPLLVIPIVMLVQTAAEILLTQLDVPSPGPGFIGIPFAIVVGWIFAGVDIGRLRKSGYRPPSILWMLLIPPLGYFIARSVALRRDRGKTWPAGIVLGISFAGLVAVVVVMISVVMAVLASFGLLPSAADPGGGAATDDLGAISEPDPRTNYGIGLIAEQDTMLGPLPESTEPYRLRVANLIMADYQMPADLMSGVVDCWDSQAIIEPGSTFPCHVIDLDLPNGVDRTGDISVTLDVDETVSYSVLTDTVVE